MGGFTFMRFMAYTFHSAKRQGYCLRVETAQCAVQEGWMRLGCWELFEIWISAGSIKPMRTMVELDCDHTLRHLATQHRSSKTYEHIIPLVRQPLWQLTTSVTLKIDFMMIMLTFV